MVEFWLVPSLARPSDDSSDPVQRYSDEIAYHLMTDAGFRLSLTLAEHFNAYLADPDEHRAILRHLLHLGGRVDYGPPASPSPSTGPTAPESPTRFELLTDELNATPAHLPGDRRPLPYQLAQP
jgi:hypothetical protein